MATLQLGCMSLRCCAAFGLFSCYFIFGAYGRFLPNYKCHVKKFKEEKPLNIFSGFSQGFRAYSGVKPRKKSRSRRWFLHWDCG